MLWLLKYVLWTHIVGLRKHRPSVSFIMSIVQISSYCWIFEIYSLLWLMMYVYDSIMLKIYSYDLNVTSILTSSSFISFIGAFYSSFYFYFSCLRVYSYFLSSFYSSDLLVYSSDLVDVISFPAYSGLYLYYPLKLSILSGISEFGSLWLEFSIVGLVLLCFMVVMINVRLIS